MASIVGSLAKRAVEGIVARAPAPVQGAVAQVRRRYETGVLDAQRALEELAELEEVAARAAATILAFPFATVGAIRELYGRVSDLERELDRRDATIRALEERLKALEKK